MIVVPNKMGFFVWSPALDKWGNSVRGVQFAKVVCSCHVENVQWGSRELYSYLAHIKFVTFFL